LQANGLKLDFGRQRAHSSSKIASVNSCTGRTDATVYRNESMEVTSLVAPKHIGVFAEYANM
jgi:hypothetical protein